MTTIQLSGKRGAAQPAQRSLEVRYGDAREEHVDHHPVRIPDPSVLQEPRPSPCHLADTPLAGL
ncbi:MAG TPA: hypothetical protein VGQ24_16030, partial [Gemmatimonadales bacterium]|nr:hypothetical protein [Gemmatimonadales bacterium]